MREGIDPVEHRRAEATARKRAAEGAFHLVAQSWLDFKRKEWADETYRKAEFVVREYLTPALRNKPISTLATPEVKPVLEAIASHAPNLATKARQYVGGIVTYAIQNGLREDGAALTLRGVVPRHRKGHIRAITRPADIGPLALAIDAYRSPTIRAALKLTMLTGLRPGVVAAVPWDEMNLKTAEWHVAAERMKMRHDHIVPLPKQAIAVSKELRAVMSNSELFQTPGFEVIRDVAVRRIRAGINLRVIRSGPGNTRDLWRSSKRDLRELRFSPADFEVGITTYLYDDTVAFISSRAEHYALSIQSAEFFAFECSLFEVLWNTSTPDRSDKPA